MAGLEAHRAGRFGDAEALYARALQAYPEHPDALNLAGALAFARGQTDKAIRLIGKALRLLPTHVDAYLNLAEALEKAGRNAEAVDTCQRALVVAPDFAEGYARLGRLHAEAGVAPLALAHCKVALALDPSLVEAQCARGLALKAQRKFTEAEAAYRLAIETAPDDLRGFTGLAAVLIESDRFAEAEAVFRQALTVQPDDPGLLASLGGVVERGGDSPGALKLFDRALALAPGSPEIAYRRAGCLRDIGEFDLAETGFRAALTARPDYAPALLALVRMKRLDSGLEPRKQLARLIADTAQPARHRVQAGFALGDLLDKAGEPDAAFRRFSEANALYAKVHAANGELFDREELRGLVNLVDARLAREYARNTAAWGNPTDLPVFVVGMPRSGTTLVEQICASHSQVIGAGELRGIQGAARTIVGHNEGREHIGDWDAAPARAEADKYALELARLGAGARRVVDKSPFNLMRLGVIGAMFPNARVIWCRRDPRDVAVSNHTLCFAQGNVYSTDQSDCAYAVRHVDRLGEVWLRESRLPILQVSYEDLVADLGAHTRRIIDFLGLDWEPACLEFHQTDRHVDTPSSWQVRQPIYSTSVGRWRRFERHLGPMLATLAAED